MRCTEAGTRSPPHNEQRVSLKAFHKFFITVAILFCCWLSVSELRNYARTGGRESFYVGFTTAVMGLALIVYFIWFLRKSGKWPAD